ncbi:MAG: hypothetical protein V7K50_27670 [Nostoc sp.]
MTISLEQLALTYSETVDEVIECLSNSARINQKTSLKKNCFDVAVYVSTRVLGNAYLISGDV